MLFRKELQKPRPSGRGAIGNLCWNTQINRGAGTQLAPDIDVPANNFSAFTHSVQAKVAAGRFSFECLLGHTLAIIANRQSEVRDIILNGDCYLASLCVPNGVPQRLTSDAIDFIAHHRLEFPWSPFHLNVDHSGARIASIDCQFLANSRNGVSEIAAVER